MNKITLIPVVIMVMASSVKAHAGDPGPDVTIDWTGPVTNSVSAQSGKNFNELTEYTSWGVGSRSNQAPYPVLTYEVSEGSSDPVVLGPGGEEYGVETEYGFDTLNDFPEGYSAQGFPLRRPGSKTLRHYMDCGQTGLSATNSIDRSEVHIRSTLESPLKIAEYSSLWIGWSEYYTHLDKSRATTIMQFRNQPTPAILDERNMNYPPYTDYTVSGPATEIALMPGADGELHYHFGVREGTPLTWSNPEYEVRTKTLDWPVETGKWYDIVLQIIYRQPNPNNGGRFRVWIYDTSSPGNDPALYSVLDTPEFDLQGSTMYDYPEPPENNPYQVYAPEIRWGLYRYNCKAQNIQSPGTQPEINAQNRYMTKYLGPVKMWSGHHTKGFRIVKPSDN
jgi:hypothetical protein